MSTALLDLDYIALQLNPGWIAYAHLDLDIAKVSISRNDAICDLTLLSAGSFDKEENLERFYLELLRRVQSRGLHFNDIADEFEYEFISELDTSSNFQMQHTFLRLCGNVIVHALLTGHVPVEEDEVRQMLSSLAIGSDF